MREPNREALRSFHSQTYFTLGSRPAYESKTFRMIDVASTRESRKATALAEWAGLRGIAPARILGHRRPHTNDEEPCYTFAGIRCDGNSWPELKRAGWHVTHTE